MKRSILLDKIAPLLEQLRQESPYIGGWQQVVIQISPEARVNILASLSLNDTIGVLAHALYRTLQREDFISQNVLAELPNFLKEFECPKDVDPPKE